MKSINLIFVCFTILICGQLTTYAQIQPARPSVSIDTLTYLKIDKLIFYQDPLEFKYGSIVESSYMPEWYKAYCANSNYEYFKNYPQEAVHFFHSKSGVTEEKLAEHMKNTEAKGGLKKSMELLPYSYFFGEIWLTYLKTGEQIVITQSYDLEKQIPNVKFNQPIKAKNERNEKVDSLKSKLIGINAYILEDKLLKRANQRDVIDQMILNSSYFYAANITSFKDMLYRSPQYIRSVIVDGKRVFETIKNTKDGSNVISTSDKP